MLFLIQDSGPEMPHRYGPKAFGNCASHGCRVSGIQKKDASPTYITILVNILKNVWDPNTPLVSYLNGEYLSTKTDANELSSVLVFWKLLEAWRSLSKNWTLLASAIGSAAVPLIGIFVVTSVGIGNQQSHFYYIFLIGSMVMIEANTELNHWLWYHTCTPCPQP